MGGEKREGKEVQLLLVKLCSLVRVKGKENEVREQEGGQQGHNIKGLFQRKTR